MSSPVSVSAVKVRRLGRFAKAALGSAPAKVIAVFERSAYVQTPAGLACLGAIGNGPLNATIDFPSGLEAGMTVTVNLAEASLWRPRRASGFDAALAHRSLGMLARAAHDRLPSEGFACVIDASRKRIPPVQALAQWLLHPSGVPDAAGLIGLGPGLTPSGDDLLGGVLCALHAIGQAASAQKLAAWVLPLARTGTSRISHAHLACAAAGECGETVNDAILALIEGRVPDLQAIDAIGHTSGWDALAGAALALEAATPP